jgi:heparanase
MGSGAQTTPEAALSEEWLSRADQSYAFYGGLRDRFEAGKPVWITEIADAACGGNPWANTFLDTFRYLDQHARLAKRGVSILFHNTLASSEYGLLDQNTFAPRPNCKRSVNTPGQAATRSSSAGFQCQGSRSAIWRAG